MDRFAKLVIVAASLVACNSFAGYAQLAQPERFSGSPGDWKFAPSANDTRYGKIAFQSNGLKVPVPGTAATMPAAYRFAANAPRFAAAALFLHPAVRTAVGIATWIGLAGLVWDAVDGVWKIPDSGAILSDGRQYHYVGNPEWFDSADEACKSFAAYKTTSTVSFMFAEAQHLVNQSYCKFNTKIKQPAPHPDIESTSSDYLDRRGSACPSGSYITASGCSATPGHVPVSQTDFQDKLASSPMPDTVPWELPFPTPLPVQQPIINPDAVPEPSHRPLFVPTGNPVPNPQYDPNAAPGPDNQPWLQPGVRIVPAPTPSNPFQVDLQPINRPVLSSDPNPDPVNDPADPNDKPKPEEQQSLCEKHPEVLACQKLDNPEDVDLPVSEKSISITPDSGWGADNASCPAPKQITVQGRIIPIPFDLFCTYMNGMRPIILAMAWLSAAFILLGARESS